MIKRILIFCGIACFYEAEQTLLENKDANVAFAEAPTGAGKSNLAMNCSLKLLTKISIRFFMCIRLIRWSSRITIRLKKYTGRQTFLKVLRSLIPLRRFR